MASSTFLGRSPAYMMMMPRNDDHHAHMDYHTNSYSQVVDAHALYPAYGAKHEHAALVPPPISASKLPSLTGLLKKMQDEPASPQHSAYSPQSDYSTRSHEQRLSPTGREMTQMPSLRTIISPTMKSAVSTPFYGGFQHERAASPLDTSFPHIAQQQLSYPSRKRSWIETNSSASAAAFYPVKERAVSPVLSVGSSAASVGPHRSRASKYCKIEGCERVSQRNNLCHSHGGKRLCKEDGCSSKDRGNGYCIKHGGGKICSMDDCEKKARRKGLCTQHFRVCDDGSDSMSSLHYGSGGMGSM